MSDSSNKKTNWLAILCILLALLLVSQTGALIYFFSNKNNSAGQTTDKTLLQNQFPTQKVGAASPLRRWNHRQPAAIATQDPWSTFETMQEDMGRMMGGLMSGLPSMMSQMNQHMGIDSLPHVDLEEKNNDYIVHADIPGLDKDKIEISVRGEILTIEGVRETSTEEQTGSFYTQERSYGSFSRSLRLPGPVDDTNVKADYQNGVLTITLPKITSEQASKKISVT